MQAYRIFTNDRGKVKGVPMYSCLTEVKANNQGAAIAKVNPDFGPPNHAVIVAIEWPPTTPESKAWLEKHT